FYHTTWTGNYKPNATAYWVVATLNAAGDRSPWSTPVAFSSGSEADTGKSSNVPANPGLTASTLSGVEDAALAAPTGLTAALVTGDPKSIRFDWTAVTGAAGYLVKRCDYDPAAGLLTGAFDM
ncbi:hypothetical protein, partial [Profundibacterium mesophilum]